MKNEPSFSSPAACRQQGQSGADSVSRESAGNREKEEKERVDIVLCESAGNDKQREKEEEVEDPVSGEPDGKKKRAALHNLGCKVNAYETEAMQQLLAEAGYEIVPFSEPADVYIVNTCTVTNVADKKSRQMLHRAKKTNPDGIVVAVGCYVQTAKEQVIGDPAVDLVIGNNRKKDLLRILEEYGSGKSVTDAFVDINRTKQEYEPLHVSSPAEHTRAFLKVQDGCNQFCSYCIIPYARGRARSRPIEEVCAEAESLAANGYRELVLTGIHISSFGIDRGETLIGLIRSLHEIKGIDRIRLGSLEPGIVTEEFAEALCGLPKVCPHFHLSLQSGSDTVLERMNRRYRTEEYEEKCRILRKFFDHPAITTDIIVGFPGETAEEFAETLSFAERIRFYEIHVFQYSKRKGTKAAAMKEQVPETVKAQRSARLIAAAGEMKREFEQWYAGRSAPVLVERKIEKKALPAGWIMRQSPDAGGEAAVPIAGSGFSFAETAVPIADPGFSFAETAVPIAGSDSSFTETDASIAGSGGSFAESQPPADYYEGFTPEYIKVVIPSHQNLENQIKVVEFSEYLY